MMELKVIEEKAILVAVRDSTTSLERAVEYLDELAFLAETAGAQTVKRVMQQLEMPDSRAYVGSGKLEEIREYVNAEEANLVIFDDELTPSQLRNIERELGCKILDRTALILDIFAKRARTATAKVQVELAQYQYLLPRLSRMWTHLERQRGGIGMRGPGETQIETDRRIILDKISLLKEKLIHIDKQKTIQRKNREHLVRAALVGYTNVGKSTLMNLISKSDVFAENKLFATLDTTVRKVVIENLPFLLSDTVGFIRKLPHTLVNSFKSTLDELRESDVLLHIVDISHPDFEEQMRIVTQTLSEIGVLDKPIITIFNKIDAYQHVAKEPDDLTPPVPENRSIEDLKEMYLLKDTMPCVFISAKNKINMKELLEVLYHEMRTIHAIRYPYNDFLY